MARRIDVQRAFLRNARIATPPARHGRRRRSVASRMRPASSGDDARDAAGSVRRHVQHDAIPHGMTVYRRSSKQGQQ
ncbi:putative x-prolyl-dipeptidyl aminopeptidase [Burkholderia thailandensis]|uniref:X-prolyl-dipeptidyl aminopeptidase n=1 Tax=Burkholderia thailandensis TaxID=57975 RepID=A0AAW9CSJ0_BURTH|nr:putative x-prolyl-dipeptidyl aminopeptidase [Burkholderia thailandensis]